MTQLNSDPIKWSRLYIQINRVLIVRIYLPQDYDKAIDFYEKRLTLSKEQQDLAAKGRTICSIGNCLQAMKQLDKSIEFYSSAMKVAEELNDQMGQAIVYGNLGDRILPLNNNDIFPRNVNS